jgi:hypothetical protein
MVPSFHKLWAEIATRADSEGWPAARFLAVLAEYENLAAQALSTDQ